MYCSSFFVVVVVSSIGLRHRHYRWAIIFPIRTKNEKKKENKIQPLLLCCVFAVIVVFNRRLCCDVVSVLENERNFISNVGYTCYCYLQVTSSGKDNSSWFVRSGGQFSFRAHIFNSVWSARFFFFEIFTRFLYCGKDNEN